MGVRRLVVANGPNIFQMLLLHISFFSLCTNDLSTKQSAFVCMHVTVIEDTTTVAESTTLPTTTGTDTFTTMS